MALILTGARSPPRPLPPPAPRSNPPAPTPEEQKSRFTVRDGFSVEIFADETLGVIKPLQIRFDERGRLWALCSPTYPHLQIGDRATDYILVLEDTKGNGTFDKQTVFWDKATFSSGIAVGFGGVWLGSPPHLLFIPMKDGDEPKPAGEPDRKSVV